MAAAANPTRTELVPIDSLVIDATIQIRKANDEATIERYREVLDQLPPVEVMETPDGLILYDGFQRTAAHQRAGRDHVPANIETGSREEALERAAVANLLHGKPLETAERDEAVRRLHQLHPQASLRELSECLHHSVSHVTISKLLDADEVRGAVMFKWAQLLSHSALAEIHNAPREHWAALTRAYDRHRWTLAQLHQAVQDVSDESLPTAYRAALVRGEAQPGDHRIIPINPVQEQTRRVKEEYASFAADLGTSLSDEQVDFDEEDEYIGDPPGYDPVGRTEERLVSVTPFVVVPVRVASGKPRMRGNRQYTRERVTVQQTIEISVSDDVLEGFGDPSDPTTKGWAMLCREVYRQMWRQRPQVWPPADETWGERA